MDLKKALMIIAIFVALSIMVAVMIYVWNDVVYVEEYDYSLRVVEGIHVGFELEPNGITFGQVPQNSIAHRPLTIVNTHNIPLRVHIESKEKKTNGLTIGSTDNLFLLEPDEKKQINITADVARGTTPGNYSGKVIIEFRKP